MRKQKEGGPSALTAAHDGRCSLTGGKRGTEEEDGLEGEVVLQAVQGWKGKGPRRSDRRARPFPRWFE